jgi:hypothetical protein
MRFPEYSDIGFKAFVKSLKQTEIIARKKEIIDSVLSGYKSPVKSLLCIGFNPAVLTLANMSVTFTQVSETAEQWLTENAPKTTVLDWAEMLANQQKFDLVIAVDEYLTFADSEEEQQNNLTKLCHLSSGLVITTLRDYKNLDFKDREFSTPALVRTDEGSRIFLEHHEHDPVDRNAWSRTVYEIQDRQLTTYGSFRCRNMFFKQCAKFSIDAGARNFLVHNNIMYKGIIKKSYEHVISMRFEQNGYFPTGRYNS